VSCSVRRSRRASAFARIVDAYGEVVEELLVRSPGSWSRCP
jgi:hypothetical protein